VGRYKVEISGINTADIPVLTNTEMIDLFKAYQQGDLEAKNQLIKGNLKLVLSMVQRFNHRYDNMDDLFQIGCVGLIKAIDNFDLKHEVRFSTYAVPMILGEMKRYLRDNQMIKVSRQLRDLSYQVLKNKEEYIHENQTEPSYQQLAQRMNITEKEVGEALDSLQSVLSLFEPLYSEEGDTLYLMDQLKDPHDETRKLCDLLSLEESLKTLNQKELSIIHKRYYQGLTQMEIANELGISQAQVSRLEKSALEELRRCF